MDDVPRADRSALASRIEARAQALTARTLAGMYANPFWDARFGERGRRFAEQDQRHHLEHLVIALRIGGPETMAGYARWLQVVLTSRGMCSRHLGENFARLAEAIGAEGISEPDAALAYLRAAEDALTYDDGPARAVQDAASGLIDDSLSAFYEAHLDPRHYGGEAGRVRCRDDLAYHLSYLADALALGRSNLFADYVRWIAGFLSSIGVPRAHLAEALAVLHRTSSERLPAEHRTRILAVLKIGQDALSEQAS